MRKHLVTNEEKLADLKRRSLPPRLRLRVIAVSEYIRLCDGGEPGREDWSQLRIAVNEEIAKHNRRRLRRCHAALPELKPVTTTQLRRCVSIWRKRGFDGIKKDFGGRRKAPDENLGGRAFTHGKPGKILRDEISARLADLEPALTVSKRICILRRMVRESLVAKRSEHKFGFSRIAAADVRFHLEELRPKWFPQLKGPTPRRPGGVPRRR